MNLYEIEHVFPEEPLRPDPKTYKMHAIGSRHPDPQFKFVVFGGFCDTCQDTAEEAVFGCPECGSDMCERCSETMLKCKSCEDSEEEENKTHEP